MELRSYICLLIRGQVGVSLECQFMPKIQRSISLIFFFSVLSCVLSAVERALIEIDVSLGTVVQSGDAPSKSMGYGSAINFSSLSTSNSAEGILDGSFSRKDIQNIIDRSKDKTLRGRTTSITYKVTNFQPGKEYVKNHEAVLHLFEFIWILNRFDYSYISPERKLVTGSTLPPSFFQDTPSNVTVHGYGEAESAIGGIDFPIAPNQQVWDIEEVTTGKDFKVIRTKFFVRKPIFVIFKGPNFAAVNLEDKRLVLEGRAILDDAMIKTVRPPYWYPFDQYSLAFKFGTIYPADVNLRFKNVEDLEVFPEKRVSLFSRRESRIRIPYKVKKSRSVSHSHLANCFRGYCSSSSVAFRKNKAADPIAYVCYMYLRDVCFFATTRRGPNILFWKYWPVNCLYHLGISC